MGGGSAYEEGLKPLALMCYLCGREFGTKSLDIHQKSCVKKRTDEQKALPKDQRIKRPEPPDAERFPKGPDAAEISAYNDEAMRIYNGQMPSCPYCQRTFATQEILETHLKSCKTAHDDADVASKDYKPPSESDGPSEYPSPGEANNGKPPKNFLRRGEGKSALQARLVIEKEKKRLQDRVRQFEVNGKFDKTQEEDSEVRSSREPPLSPTAAASAGRSPSKKPIPPPPSHPKPIPSAPPVLPVSAASPVAGDTGEGDEDLSMDPPRVRKSSNRAVAAVRAVRANSMDGSADGSVDGVDGVAEILQQKGVEIARLKLELQQERQHQEEQQEQLLQQQEQLQEKVQQQEQLQELVQEQQQQQLQELVQEQQRRALRGRNTSSMIPILRNRQARLPALRHRDARTKEWSSEWSFGACQIFRTDVALLAAETDAAAKAAGEYFDTAAVPKQQERSRRPSQPSPSEAKLERIRQAQAKQEARKARDQDASTSFEPKVQPAQQPSVVVPVVDPPPSAFVGIADELQKLAALRGDGILTDAEFAEAKRLVLDGGK
jgi:hypothetical protein